MHFCHLLKSRIDWVFFGCSVLVHWLIYLVVVVVVPSLSHVWRFVAPWTALLQASLSFTISLSLLRLVSIESMIPSSHLILCRPISPLPSNFLSIKFFSSESALCIRWPSIVWCIYSYTNIPYWFNYSDSIVYFLPFFFFILFLLSWAFIFSLNFKILLSI